MVVERAPRVNREDGVLRVSNIPSDYDPETTLSLTVSGDGDVSIGISEPLKGTTDVALATFRGGGKNFEIARMFRELAQDLATLIESKEE